MEDQCVVVLSEKTQDLLNELISECGVEDYVLDITPGSKRGDNYLGVIAKVHVKSKNGSYYWIVKSAPQNEVFRSFIPIPKVFGREIFMYETVIPEFEKLQRDKGILNTFKSYAKYHISSMIEPYETLIMDDLKEVSYKLHDRHQPLDYNHVLLVMREYGRLHALSFAMRDQNPSLFQKLADNLEDLFWNDQALTSNLEKMLNEQCDRVVSALDPVAHKSAYDKFLNYRHKMFELTKKVVRSELAGEYAVICHGDCWMNNLLFKYSNLDSPTKLCFIDWQLARLSSPALDLSYFLFTCTDKQFRDKHYDAMIHEYYNSLSSFLIELGSDPENLFPFDVLQQHLKKFSVFGLYMAVQVLYFMVSDQDEIPDIHNFTDEDEAVEKFKYVSKNIEKYNSRIKGVVLDFVKFNYDF